MLKNLLSLEIVKNKRKLEELYTSHLNASLRQKLPSMSPCPLSPMTSFLLPCLKADPLPQLFLPRVTYFSDSSSLKSESEVPISLSSRLTEVNDNP